MAVRVGIIGTGWGVAAQVPAFKRAGLGTEFLSRIKLIPKYLKKKKNEHVTKKPIYEH
jgi:hypothetical protein